MAWPPPTTTRLALLAALACGCFGGPGCERRVPLLARMPDPPADMLVALPPSASPEVTRGIREAAELLPDSPAYREAAAALSNLGRTVGVVELGWCADAVQSALKRLRVALRKAGPAWPRGPGGPEWRAEAVSDLADAFAVSVAYRAMRGEAAEALALAADGLRLVAHVQQSPGPEAETTAGRAQGPQVRVLRTLVSRGLLPADHLPGLMRTLSDYESTIRPLKVLLQEGLTEAAEAKRVTLPEEWVAAVRSTWRTQPQIVPAEALTQAWAKWTTLISAADLPTPEAIILAETISPTTNNIELLYAPPPGRIIRARATRLQALDALRIEIALARYRATTGQYPATLSALVPVYMAKLPSDPLTGAPFRYRRDREGYSLDLATTSATPAAAPLPG